MSNEQETIADIIAEKRELAEKIRWGTPSLDEIEAAVNLEFDANRIEAAWKREKAEIEASALAAGGMVEASRHKQVGNAAAMREAANATIEAIKKTDLCDYVGFETERCKGCDYYLICEAVDRLRQALAAPPKNCDRHTGWLTAIKEFNNTEGRRKPWGDDVYDTRFLDWLFATATEQKGGNDGK